MRCDGRRAGMRGMSVECRVCPAGVEGNVSGIRCLAGGEKEGVSRMQHVAGVGEKRR